jgi:hypothetical protein
VREAAKKAGTNIQDQYEQLRLIDPLRSLQEQSSLLQRGNLPVGKRGIVNAAIDAGGIRAFPGLRYLGGNSSPIMGGQGGKAALAGKETDEDRKRKKKEKAK